MKRRILWLGLNFLLVLALVLVADFAFASGKKATKEAPTAAPGEPQYGGTLSMFHYWGEREPVTWDLPVSGSSPTMIWGSPYRETLLVGDIEKYGPRGTNEFSFKVTECVPEEFAGGCNAESWELPDAKTIIFHIRPGIMWAADHVDFMESRELTADDVTFHIQRKLDYRASIGSPRYSFVDSVEATDKYTVVIKCNRYDAAWSKQMGLYKPGATIPREVLDAGVNDWKNQVGTGPFIFTSYVKGSQAVYERNPNYWGKTTINGKEYQLPFIDKLVFPVIVDESTQIAAIRTAAIDLHVRVPLVYQDSLTKSSPDLIQSQYPKGTARILELRCDQKPWSDRNVRRAMMIGTDLGAIRNLVFVKGNILSYPIGQGLSTIHTPLNELPESSQLLYKYNPELAKKMLADAGYPNGFKMDLHLLADPEEQDIVDLLQDMWAKIGVTVNQKVMDQAALLSLYGSLDFKDSVTDESTITAIDYSLGRGLVESDSNHSRWDNKEFAELFASGMSTMDPVKRSAILKKACLVFIDDVPGISFAEPVVLNCYWPWVKNYFGEIEAGFYCYIPMVKRLWIDQAMKAKMGH